MNGSDCPTLKEQFTKAGARSQRDSLRRSGDPSARSLRAYRCMWCRCWHVGHVDRKKERLRARTGTR